MSQYMCTGDLVLSFISLNIVTWKAELYHHVFLKSNTNHHLIYLILQFVP